MKASTRAKEKYNKEHYDRVTFRVQKDFKHFIEVAAERAGMSMNEFISDAVMMNVFHTIDSSDEDDINPGELDVDEWIRYRKKRWAKLPKEIKPKHKRLAGMRSEEKEMHLLKASWERKQKFNKMLEDEVNNYG